jgi:hypothetical protein
LRRHQGCSQRQASTVAGAWSCNRKTI